jgi:hypothetical protein
MRDCSPADYSEALNQEEGNGMHAAATAMLVWAAMSQPDQPRDESAVVAPIAQAANVFLQALDDGQREKVTFPFDDEERYNWHYVPRKRAGVPLKEMTDAQQALALALIESALSQDGYDKVDTIRQLEDVLQIVEEGRGPIRDKGLYYISIFGEPSGDSTWGLRFEGHHISLHWTVVNGRAIATVPQFLGANPAEVRIDLMKGTRALRDEEDLARTLVKSFDEAQRAEAVLSDVAPSDILSGTDREAMTLEHVGIAHSAMNDKQQQVLTQLLEVYANVQKRDVAERRLKKIRDANLDHVKFAWMGGFERGERHYYRIQGPTFLIEYDNTQNNANHIHTVWRDFDGDFGEDLLKKHYEEHAETGKPGVHEH